MKQHKYVFLYVHIEIQVKSNYFSFLNFPKQNFNLWK